MELVKYTTEWVRGEVLQGRIMILIGCLILVAGISIFKGNNELLKGMLIPLGLVALIMIGYGAMQNIVRPNHLSTILELVKEDPQKALDMELKKSKNDDRVYSIAKIIWPICMIAMIGLYFFVSQPYYKGLAIGLMGLFLFLMILDSTLHQRLDQYLIGMQGITLP